MDACFFLVHQIFPQKQKLLQIKGQKTSSDNNFDSMQQELLCGGLRMSSTNFILEQEMQKPNKKLRQVMPVAPNSSMK